MLTREQSIRRNKNIISSLLLLLVPFGGYLVYKDFNKTPTFYEGGTLTNYERTLKLDKQYSYEEGKIQSVPDTEYLGYFTFLKDGFNEHTISLTSEDKPKSIHKHVHFDTDTDSVTNTFTTDGIVIDTNYKTTETKNKTLGAPTPQIKQTFILRNTTDETKETNFTSTTRLNTNTITYNGRTITITEIPTILKAEEKTASIPEFASDIGYENPETEQFENYTHTYHTPAFLTFETSEGTAVYSWKDAKHLNHTVTLYEHDNSYYLSFTVSDITIEPQSSFTIDPAYGLDEFQNYDVRYDGYVEMSSLGQTIVVGDVNGDSYSDLILGTDSANYEGTNSGAAFVIFGTSTVATGTFPQNISTNYNIRYDGAAGDYLTAHGGVATGDVNGDGLADLIIGAWGADNGGSNSGSVWVIFSTLIDDVGTTTGNIKPLSTATNYNLRYDGSSISRYLTYDGALITGDVNGDGLGDLIFGTYISSHNGLNSGSAWVIFSTLIDDVGATTGNIRPVSTETNYNLRYDGAIAYDYLTYDRALAVGDVNGDSFPDLILGAYGADYNGGTSGSAWVLFSTLIDDVGTTTGNTRSLGTSTDYNIRYDGDSVNAYLTRTGTLVTGDVNGDGLSDLVLGAYFASNNGSNSGSAWVLFSTLIDDVGTTTGNNFALSTSTNYNIRYDGAASDNLTRDVALATGDVNGDGLSDLVLGAKYADNNGNGSGSAWVLFSTLIDDVGTTTGNNFALSTSTNYNIRYDGGAVNDNLTHDGVLTIGDVNGDGLADLLLGAAYADNNGGSSGSAWVLFSTLIDNVGTTTGNTRSLGTSTDYNIRYDGAVALDYLTTGGAFTTGDMNGDGLADLIVGTLGADTNGENSGAVWAVSSTLIDDVGVSVGNTFSLGTSTNYTSRYDGGENSILYLGTDSDILIDDVNGDSISDLIIGVPRAHYGEYYSGSVFVVFGTSTTGVFSLHTSTSYNVRFDGEATNDKLSFDGVITTGDVNGDGLADLILGTKYADNNGTDSGSGYVIFSTFLDDFEATTGNNLSLAASTSFNVRYDGGSAGHQLMYVKPVVDDVNGDGLGDLVLATREGDPYGYVMVAFSTLFDDLGTTTGTIRSSTNGSHFNLKFNGYGGCVPDNCAFGSGVLAGDVNGDGLSDLAMGDDTTYGNVFVVFSTKIDDVGTTTGNTWNIITGANHNIRYNSNVNNDFLGFEGNFFIHDVNGDSLPDLILGAKGADNNGSGSGSVWVMFSTLIDDVGASTGNLHLLDNSSRYNVRFDGAAGDGLTNQHMLLAGDVNGDGYGDLILGAPSADNNGSSSGSVWVIFSTLIDDVGASTGNNRPLTTSAYYNVRFDGDVEWEPLAEGGALAWGDVNGDGYGDLIVGQRSAQYDDAKGSAYVMLSTLLDDLGTSTGNDQVISSSTSYSIRYDGAVGDELTEDGVIAVGDVNMDGLSDLIIGSIGADNGGINTGSLWIVHAEPPPKYKMQGDVNFTGSVQFR